MNTMTIPTLLNEHKLFIHDNNGQPVGVILPMTDYLLLQEILEDLEDMTDMNKAITDYRQGLAVPAEDVFTRLGL